MKQLRAGWYVNTMNANDIYWNVCYDALVCYGRVYGTCNVVSGCKYEAPNGKQFRLSSFLHNQRIAKAMNRLSMNYLTKLQLLVDRTMLDWEVDPVEAEADDKRWNVMYGHFLEYGVKHNGYGDLYMSYILHLADTTEIKLGKWLLRQRQQYKLGILPQDRLDRLQVLVDQNKLDWKTTKMFWKKPTQLPDSSS